MAFNHARHVSKVAAENTTDRLLILIARIVLHQFWLEPLVEYQTGVLVLHEQYVAFGAISRLSGGEKHAVLKNRQVFNAIYLGQMTGFYARSHCVQPASLPCSPQNLIILRSVSQIHGDRPRNP